MRFTKSKYKVALLIIGIGIAVNAVSQAQQSPGFVWSKLPGHTNLPAGWASVPGSIDQSHGIIYSLSNDGVFWKYDIGSNTFTQLPVTGWPGRIDYGFVYNPEENTIWLTLSGRGQMFRLPVTGGTVTSIGSSGASSSDFGDITFWNPVTHKFGTAFGYGYMAVRNWRWEFGTNDSDWVQIEANSPGRQPWCRQGGAWAVDNAGQQVFVGMSEGNSSGNQGQTDPGFDIWADNRFDYLRDLWLLNLNSNAWVNLIPLNTQVRIYGPIVYFPPENMLVLLNGQQIPFTTPPAYGSGVWTFRIAQDTNFANVTVSGDIPNPSDDPNSAYFPYYDSLNRRIIYFNNSGVYALAVNESCSPHKATAAAQLDNGFVVGTTITDPGCGYTNAPAVLIQGGGGSGAAAIAVVSNGVVVKIIITDAGAGYTSTPTIVIGSPPFVPTLSIAVSKVKVTQHVVLGRNYVLEASTDLVTWTATGPQFTAQSETIVSEFDVDVNGRFFRIRQVP